MLHLSRRTRGATYVRTAAAAAHLTWRVAFPPAARRRAPGRPRD